MTGAPRTQLDRLLDPVPVEEFLSSSWGQTFRYVEGWKGKFADLLPWDLVNQILRQHRLDFPRLRLVLNGKSLPPASYLRYAGTRRKAPIPRIQPVELTDALRRGATLVIDAVDELFAPLEHLAEDLELSFGVHVQINTYAGWHTSPGFDLHWDDHDVFVLQVAGRKEWSIFGVTESFPVTGELGKSTRPSTENPVWKKIISDGDFLYIPRGWWHVAVPLNEPTVHLTVGIHNRTGLDLMGWFTERMKSSEIFRKDLPRLGTSADRVAHLEIIRSEILAGLTDDLLDRYFDNIDSAAESRSRLSLPWSVGSDLPLDDQTCVRLAAPRLLKIKVENDTIEFSCLKKHWRFRAAALPLLRMLNENRVCTLRELYEIAKDDIDYEVCMRFLSELVIHGLITIDGD